MLSRWWLEYWGPGVDPIERNLNETLKFLRFFPAQIGKAMHTGWPCWVLHNLNQNHRVKSIWITNANCSHPFTKIYLKHTSTLFMYISKLPSPWISFEKSFTISPQEFLLGFCSSNPFRSLAFNPPGASRYFTVDPAAQPMMAKWRRRRFVGGFERTKRTGYDMIHPRLKRWRSYIYIYNPSKKKDHGSDKRISLCRGCSFWCFYDRETCVASCSMMMGARVWHI